MTLQPERIDLAFEAFPALLSEDQALAAEFESTISSFFHGRPDAGEAREVLLAARRHLEWFTLERASRHLDGLPVSAAAEAWLGRCEPDAVRRDELQRSLRDSVAGIFEVTGVQQGEGAWLRDLAGFGEYPVAEVAGSDVLEQGDLLVGRLFPLGEGIFHVSRAAGFYRNAELRKALIRDLDQAREQRGGKVLHVAQAELEAMFWSSSDGDVIDGSDPEQELREMFAKAGVPEHRSTSMLGQLSSVPFDPARLVHGSGDVLGEMLDELAFETSIDLESARRLLVRFWSRSAPLLGPAGKARVRRRSQGDGEGDGEGVNVRKAMEAFDAGRKAGADLETLFRALEQDLELEGSALEEDHPAPDFPGVVGAMVEEFLWEVGQTEGPEAAAGHEALRPLGRFGQSIGTFENLNGDDLLRFTTFWIHEERLLREPEEARALLRALRAFCEWAQREHEVPLLDQFGSTLGELEHSLPRVAAANGALGRAAQDTADTGELLTFVAKDGELVRVRDGGGLEHQVSTSGSWAEHLRAGDPLRGRVQMDDSLSVFCLYPPEAAQLARGS